VTQRLQAQLQKKDENERPLVQYVYVIVQMQSRNEMKILNKTQLCLQNINVKNIGFI